VLQYNLRSELRTRRAARQAAERAAARRGEDIAYPTWDSLRVEDNEEPPAVIVTVSDAQGRVIRRITGPTGAGLQRVVWDLRHAGPSAPVAARPGADDDDEPRSGGGAGPLVTPGVYTASLAKRVNGITTPLGEPVKVEVYMLDSAATRPPTLLAFQQQVTRLQRAVSGANAFAGELAERVAALRRAIDETPTADAKLGTDARALERALREVREALAGDPTVGRRQEPTPPSLLGRMGLMAQGARSMGAPTGTQRSQYDIVSREFAQVYTRLRASSEGELRRIETAAEAAGVPWTSGRLPDWRPEGD